MIWVLASEELLTFEFFLLFCWKILYRDTCHFQKISSHLQKLAHLCSQLLLFWQLSFTLWSWMLRDHHFPHTFYAQRETPSIFYENKSNSNLSCLQKQKISDSCECPLYFHINLWAMNPTYMSVFPSWLWSQIYRESNALDLQWLKFNELEEKMLRLPQRLYEV